MRGSVLILLVLLSGCGGDSPPTDPPGVAARGVALLGTKPAAGAVLLFHGNAGGLPPRAVVKADGSFDLTAPPGTYAVTVEWRSGSEENGGESKNRVRPAYTRKESTPLKAVVADGKPDLGTFTLQP